MSEALVWHLIRDNNSFMVKRGRTARIGAVQFSKEPGNLMNSHCFKYSGIANNSTVDISADLSMTTKDTKLTNKPGKASSTQALTLCVGKSNKKLDATMSSYRPDLLTAAKLRLKKSARALSAKKGYSKSVVKSSKRGPLSR